MTAGTVFNLQQSALCMFYSNGYIYFTVNLLFFLSLFLSFFLSCITTDAWLLFLSFRPFWLMIILAVLIQHITGRFCFIKKTAGTRDLDNRWFTIFVAMYCRAPVLSADISRRICCAICIGMKSVSALAPEIQNRLRSNMMSLLVLLSDSFSVVLVIWLTTSLLSRRGNLFLLTYLLFPVNVLIGVLLAVWRLIITALFNIVHMGRMDISLLNRNVEAFDPGEPEHSALPYGCTQPRRHRLVFWPGRSIKVKFKVICFIRHIFIWWIASAVSSAKSVPGPLKMCSNKKKNCNKALRGNSMPWLHAHYI